MIVLHYRGTGTEFIAADDPSEIVAILPHTLPTAQRPGCTIVYADGGTVSVKESPIEVIALIGSR